MEQSGVIESDCKVILLFEKAQMEKKPCYFNLNSAWTIVLQFCRAGGA